MNKQYIHKRSHQRGVALIMALMVVSIVTTIAVTIISNSYLRNKRIYRQIASLNVQAYHSKVDAYARKALKHDKEYDVTKKVTEQFDGCSDIWAEPVRVSLGDDSAYFTGTLSDTNGRFNLNSLNGVPSSSNVPNNAFPNSSLQMVFMNLLMSFNYALAVPIEIEDAMRITAALIDWLDENNEPTSFSGAEGGYYQSLGFTYKPANRAMTDVTELLQVLQVLDDKTTASHLFELLLPHITVWPRYAKDGRFLMNVNTMSEELLRSLITPKLTTNPELGYQVLLSDDFKGFNLKNTYENTSDLNEAIANVNSLFESKGMEINATLLNLGLISDTFELKSEVALEAKVDTLYTILQRTPEAETKVNDVETNKRYSVNILRRSRSGLESSPCT